MRNAVFILFVSCAYLVYGQGDAKSDLLTWEKKLEEATVDTVKADALFNIGARLYGTDNPRARKLLQEAIDLLPYPEANIMLRGEIYHYLAAINNDQGNFTVAMEQFIEAERQFRKINDSLRIANVYYNLSVLHFDQGNIEDAKTITLKAKEINEAFKDTFALAYNYVVLGDCYKKDKKIDSALMAYEKSAQFSKMAGNTIGFHDARSDLALMHAEKGNYEDGINLLKECIAFSTENEVHELYPVIYTKKLAQVYKKKEDYNNALKYIDQSLNLALKQNNKKNIVLGYVEKSQIEAALGNYKNAYEDAKLIKIYNDSLINKENIKKINELELRYEFEKQEEVSQAQIETLEAKNRVKNQWILFGGLGLLALFTIIYLLRSRKFVRNKQQLQEQFSQNLIKGQEDERFRIARELHDSVGQKLALLIKKSDSMGEKDMKDLSGNTLDELRGILNGLHPPTLERIGVSKSLESLINEVDENTNIFFTYDIDSIDNDLDEEQSLHFYRIIQESLNNIIKHAEAKAVSIDIKRKEEVIEATIEDNGKGFNFTEKLGVSTGFGMKTLLERAKIMGSKLQVASEINKGTIIKMQIPV